MFFVRPIARDDLAGGARAVRAHRHRPHDAARQPRAARLAHRALARVVRRHRRRAPTRATCSCWSTAARQRRGSSDRVVGIGAIEAAVGLTEPWYNYPRRHARPRVARARRLHGRADAVPRQRPHRAHRAVLAVPRPGVPPGQERRAARQEPAAVHRRVRRPLRAEGDRRAARPARRRRARARSGKAWAGISSRWSTRPPTT